MQLELLPKIKSPADIREFNSKQLRQLCDEVRSYTIDVITKTGGHLAPTLGVVELTVALHHVYNTPKDKIVWDVGHQGYAHKILTGRFEKLTTIRQYKGLSGFLKRTESEYDVFGAGHASTSISAALGIAAARDHHGDDFRVSAVIGDGAMTGGLAFEGLNNAGHLRKQLLVILNDNDMSISPNVGAIRTHLTHVITNPLYNRVRDEIWRLTGGLPMGKKWTRTFIKKIEEGLKNLIVPGIIFHELGFRYFGPIDGHDVEELVHTLNNIKNIKTPVLLHVVTKKGKGMDVAEKDPVGYHGVKATPTPNTNGQPEPVTDIPSFQSVFGHLSREVARNNKEVVCITAAMGEGTGLIPFKKEFPDRYYDVGIAEGHGVTFASGLAAEGMRPICAIYSTFLQRAYDHVVHDAAIQHLPVIFCMDRSGIAGEDGPTHHGALDISYLRCIQDIVIAAPKNGNDFRNLLYTALDITDRPIAIRYPKASAVEFDQNGQAELLPIGCWEIERHGSDAAILAVGPMVYDAIKAAEKLESNGISSEVVNCQFIKPMDEAYLQSALKKFKVIVTIEEGVIKGGFGEGVISWLSEHGFHGGMKRLGLPDSYVEHGPRNVLLQNLGLDTEGLVNTVSKLMADKTVSI
ncbi:MAG: 1-deoxy-D-xylulose-5-phosphate synthase [Candidatus Marinimicrobia bacterium]|jgi:1-deoxy-D-xylulose-5-phosphate synthase|nr:1-deoxy-D-xylulose-5-phosphate synthase [Candidatus Neomarinimicrobiota bacterium]MDP6500747.1 1-deoxy-D-xylulose-5-phosphate synthase [Candidatus Neomarinimicrobiota bacterium]MDP6725787.1 1-deoxy-D-xylulose-5-phosphate synthase [Candidatus Neomarinimicrobiota bacterium]|tara:strand:- start:8400 stop:10298 length:1899 start_codon:yes stop_codon:yes gene_type:complete